MWNGGCVIEPRKGSIEVGGSLWYNGLVFALCQAIFRSTAAAAVAAWCHCVFKWILPRHFWVTTAQQKYLVESKVIFYQIRELPCR